MKPRRERKHDRLHWGAQSPETLAVDHALAPFDRAANEANRTWGIDRLVELVSPETAAKFGGVIARLNEAIDANDPDRVAAYVGTAIRGYAALDAEARRLGHTPPIPHVIETDVDGHHFGVLVDNADVERVRTERPTLRLYTLREVSIALRMLEDAGVAAIKDAFPAGAEVVAYRPRPKFDGDDEIPF
jgi:hypothetical protein